MRLRLVACEVFTRELSWAVARSERTVDAVWLPKALHDGSRATMCAPLPAGCEAVVLGMGLCGRGIDGLRAPAVPLVVPRVHDCRAVFLGGAVAGEAFTRDHPDTYLLTSGWLERPSASGRPGTQGWGTGLPDWDELVAKYGEDNAAYLRETLDPLRHYRRCCHVAMGCGWDAPFGAQAAGIAKDCGWSFCERAGDMGLITRLVDGPWDHPDILVVPPGARISATGDDRVMAVQAEG